MFAKGQAKTSQEVGIGRGNDGGGCECAYGVVELDCECDRSTRVEVGTEFMLSGLVEMVRRGRDMRTKIHNCIIFSSLRVARFIVTVGL